MANRSGLNSMLEKVIKIISSKYFFYFIIFLAVSQALWYALSFTPSLFDEPKHLGRIWLYADHISPFLGDQRVEWDHLGVISRDASYLFYYIMSWPLRLLELLTSNTMTQIIGLRIICIGFFVGGLTLYRQTFLAIKGVSPALVNIALLFLVITPVAAPFPGAVNYDNLVFLLFSALLLFSVKVLNEKKVSFLNLAAVLIIGLVMSLVKWTALALFVPIVLFITYRLYIDHKKAFIGRVIDSAKRTPQVLLVTAILGLSLSIALFIERPVLNFIQYGRPEPLCDKVLTHDRCLEYHDYAIYSQVDENKPDNFRATGPSVYFFSFWMDRMINTQVSLLPWNAVKLSPSLPIIEELYFAFAVIGTTVVLINTKTLLNRPLHTFMFTIIIIYSTILFLFLYRGYRIHGIPAAINARYLIPIMPLIFYLVTSSFNDLLSGKKLFKVSVLLITLAMFTQGGGIITQSLTAQNRLYWPNETTRTVNNKFQQIVKPLVME